MDIIEKLIDLIIANFDFSYMITINVLTYVIIKIIDYINKEKSIKTLYKRIVLLCSIIIVTTVYVVIDYEDYVTLFNSAICAPVFYSWILRPILIKCNIGYKQYDDTLN